MKSQLLHHKITYKSTLDCSPEFTSLADKFKVRQFVEETVGKQYLSKIYFVGNDLEAINYDALPSEFVVKANHGSGGCVIVSQAAPQSLRLPRNLAKVDWNRYLVHPHSLNLPDLEAIMKKWLGQNYGRSLMWPEMHYQDIDPLIIIEELLVQESGDLVSDLKFWVFHGKCEIILEHKRNQNTKTICFYSPLWQPLDIRYVEHGKEIDSHLPSVKPHNLDEMLDVACKLARNFDFVRVDLYNTKQGIVFGELTFFPTLGRFAFTPTYWNNVI